MGKLFGTDGVRGLANEELSPELAFNLGKAGAYVLTKMTNHAPKIIVGMDTRLSCDMLEAALCAGMCSVGAQVIAAGVLPTPAIAYLVRKYKLDAGVMISASHNPFFDNGIKFFNQDGYKLADKIELEIEDIIENGLDKLPKPTGEKIGFKTLCPEALSDYEEFLAKTVSGVSCKGLKIALDCANGATYKSAPDVFNKLGAEVFVLNNNPDGVNINKDCGSTHIEGLQKYVVENKMDIGIAFDGDGDRCLLVDEKGCLVDGDQIMSICANYLKGEGRLKNNTLVATIMSNLGLFIMGEKYDINILKTAVGDRYVLEKMLEEGHILGGEQSGHVIFLEHNTTGDGMLTALQVVSIMIKKNESLAELNSLMEVLPQVLVNAKVGNTKKALYMENETIKSEIERIEAELSKKGRVLIRPSGTEPVIRIMLEGQDRDYLKEEATKLAKLFEECLKD